MRIDMWEKVRQTKRENTQGTFDRIVAHLRKQGVRCVGPDGQPRYFAGKLRCPGGCLLSNEELKDITQSSPVGVRILPDHYTNNATRFLFNRGYDLNLVHDLQSLHDEVSPNCWEAGFCYLAYKFDIDYTPISKQD